MEPRPATSDDVPAITELINRAFRVERLFVDGDRITAAEVAQWMTRGQFLLLEDSGLAACVYVEVRGERGYFGLLSVDPARQKSGLGRQLVAAAEDHCRAAGCRHLDLQTVNVREELPPFYRRLGYHEYATAPFPPNVPTKIPVHFVKMTKPL